MFGYFLGVKICKFNVLHNPSSFQHYDRPYYSFRCNIESKHFTYTYRFKYKPFRLSPFGECWAYTFDEYFWRMGPSGKSILPTFT